MISRKTGQTPAILRNKGAHYYSVKSKEEADAKGCERDKGNSLSCSSEGMAVIEMERRIKCVV